MATRALRAGTGLLAAVLALWLALAPGAAQVAPAAEPEAAPADAAEPEAPPADAAEPAPAPDFHPALTDPGTPLGAFDLRLTPLTADELAALAETWQGIVQDKLSEIVDQQIALARAGEGADAARARLDALFAERGDLFARYGLVLDAWENKGGDAATIASYRTYRSAILIQEARTSGLVALAMRGLNWLTAPDGGLSVAFRIGVVVVSLLALLVVARFVRGFSTRAIGRIPNLSKLLQSYAVFVIYWLTIAVGLLVVLSSLGIDITPIFAVIGGASFVMAFALQDTLGNLAAGIMIMVNRPFDEGDYVDIGGVAGTVKSVSIVSTKVTTPDNQVIVVPNSKVWGNIITNVTASATRRVDLVFSISHEDSIDEAQAAIEAVVRNHPLVLADPEPLVRVNALGPSSVDFVCWPWARSVDYLEVHADLIRQVKAAFDAAGISIPYPQRDLHLRLPPGTPPSIPAADAGKHDAGGDSSHMR